MPDSALTQRAIELVPGTMDGKPAAVQRKTTSNLLRVCIREVDGEATSFDKLRGRSFDKVFGPKERGLLTQMFKRLTQPTAAEQDYFDDSLTVSAGDDGSYRWHGRILENSDLERLDAIERELYDLAGELESLAETSEAGMELAREIEELENERADIEDSALRVSGVLPGTDEIDRSVEQVPKEHQKRPSLAQKTAAENVLRNCIKSYEEPGHERVSLSYPKLAGGALDEEFTPKEQNMILVGIMELSEPSKDEVEDFMTTVSVK
ncbi:MAG: hypothetical protein U5L04_01695 [Trueperaceae bacterium]|nr:hypothetical protein [Trueperaceae bacterium]